MSEYLGSSVTSITQGASRAIVDLVFSNNCLILTDLVKTGILPILNTAPLIGFYYENPSQLGLYSYSYSEYPYLNRTAVANSVMKNSSTITIKGLRPITRANSVVVNYLANSTILSLLDKYIMRGGRFKLLTMWGPVSNLVMESIDGVTEFGQGGVAFDFTLRKIYTAESTSSSVASALLRIITG